MYIPFCKVYVAPEEYESYIDYNPRHEENIVKCLEGIQGNVSRVRNYILDKEFENGADIVCIVDDDLKAIEHFEMSEDGSYAYEKVKVKQNINQERKQRNGRKQNERRKNREL